MFFSDYSDLNFDWSARPSLVQPREDLLEVYKEMGFSRGASASLVASGYVASKYSSTIIDRFHGGPMMSSDGRTRFSERDFKGIIDEGGSMSTPFQVYHAKSNHDVLQSVEKIRSSAGRRNICFRGQTSHHSLQREIPNPKLNHPILGETSLVPSVWRLMLRSAPTVFPEFHGISMFEWSSILYKLWPMDEIISRERALQEKGEWLYTVSDMEECSDELLRAFGKFRGDLLIDEAVFQTGLLTLMQHYGLPSPFLDLTTDIEVAVFFATHKFRLENGRAKYDFVGSNSRQSIIYVLSLREGDMYTNDRNRVFEMARPERPRRQSCVVAPTNAWSINLPADFLVGAIFLDYDIATIGHYGTHDLFPEQNEDPLLKAWVSAGQFPITVF